MFNLGADILIEIRDSSTKGYPVPVYYGRRVNSVLHQVIRSAEKLRRNQHHGSGAISNLEQSA